jgi:CheY-like chemotaxis protein
LPGSDSTIQPGRGIAELTRHERAPARLTPERRPGRDERWRRQQPEPAPFGGSGAAGRPAPTRRVLVVDDELAMRALCRVNLTVSGMAVVEARDGVEALALVAAERPDLILLDVMMPGLDGWQVAERLAADPDTREIPIVFLTARADTADRVRGRDLGAVGYVTKPFDPVGIADLVERTLERLANGEREQLRAEIVDPR